MFFGDSWTETPVDPTSGGFADIENRNVYHDNISRVREYLSNVYGITDATAGATSPLQIISLVGMSAEGIAELAETDIAYRYALVELNPFAVVGDPGIYAQHNSNGELELENFTKEYLQDRAEYLALYIQRNQADTDELSYIPEDGPKATEEGVYQVGQGEGIVIDHDKDITIFGSNVDKDVFNPNEPDYTYSSKVIFASEDGGELKALKPGSSSTNPGGSITNDRLYGSIGEDIIYGYHGSDLLVGGKGNDTLTGGKHNDVLMGGADSDTYVYETGDGRDVIQDIDGINILRINGKTGFTAKQVARDGNIYLDEDGNTYLYIKDDNILIVSLKDDPEGGSITINGFDAINNFGITLEDYQDPEIPTNDDDVYVVTNDIETRYGDRSQAGQGHINDKNITYDAAQYWDYVDTNDIYKYRFEGGNKGDTLTGGQFMDHLMGRDGDDVISGLADIDRIEGGLGNDYIQGGDGIDFLAGNILQRLNNGEVKGSYVAEAADSSDHIDGGLGNDHISGDEGDDVLIGGAGEDNIAGGEGADTISGGDDKDTIFGDSRREYITVNTVTEYIESADPEVSYNDIISGGGGDDIILGEIGDDTIDGGEGNDWIQGDRHHSADQLEINGEADPTFKQLDASLHGNDTIYGGAGEDEIQGNGGNDTIFGGIDNDHIWGDDNDGLEGQYHGSDVLHGDAGEDQIVGGGGDDTIYGGTENDFLAGDTAIDEYGNYNLSGEFHGKDTLHGGEGNDDLIGSGDNDTLYGDEGNDTLYGDSQFDKTTTTIVIGGETFELTQVGDYKLDTQYHGDDKLYGGIGEDKLYGGAGKDSLYGGADNDILYGQEGDDHLYGGAGVDSLIGGEGNDVLDGGAGNDTLIGGEGSNTYHFGYGSGQDTIHAESGATDTIVMGTGIRAGDLQVYRAKTNPDQLYIKLNDADGLLLSGFFSGNDGVTKIEFGDETFWTRQDLINFTMQGSDGDDYIVGSPDGSDLSGGAGDDHLIGQGGDDTLVGGVGNDTLEGGGGHNTFEHGSGDGHDTILLDGGSSSNTVKFGSGMTADNTRLSRTGDDLTIGGTESDGDVTVKDFFKGNAPNELSALTFVTGETWDYDEITKRTKFVGIPGYYDLKGDSEDNILYQGESLGNAYGGGGNDIIYGGANMERLYGEDGSDQIYAADGGDTVYGGEGADFLYGEAGNDTLEGGAGDDELYGGDDQDILRGGTGEDKLFGGAQNDRLYGGDNNDTLRGGDYSDTLYGDDGDDHLYGEAHTDTLYGGKGDDTLDGGEGSDLLYGEAGEDTLSSIGGSEAKWASLLAGGEDNDTYVIRKGDNWLKIDDALGINTIELDSEFDVQNIRLSGGTEGYVYFMLSDTDVLLINPDQFSHLKFKQGEDEYSADDILAIAGDPVISFEGGHWKGTPLNDRMIGSNYKEDLYGEAGDDVIETLGGDDKLYGGLGDDTLIGGKGDNTYRVFAGEGNDTIELTKGEDSTLQLLNVASIDDLSLSMEGVDTVITFNTTGETLRIKGHFDAEVGGFTGLRTFMLSDRKVRGISQLIGDQFSSLTTGDDIYLGNNEDEQLEALDGNDFVYGFGGNDTIDGGSGADTLSGGTGSDTLLGGENNDNLYGGSEDDKLIGGQGNDTLDGGQGTDTYLFNLGDGVDHLVVDRNDIITFGEGILHQDLKLVSRYGDVQQGGIEVHYTDTDYIVLTPGAAVNEVQFTNSDGSPSSMSWKPFLSLGETVYGKDLDLEQPEKVWHVYGSTASSTLYGSSYYRDTIHGGTAHEKIEGGSGIDTLYGNDGNDEILGGTGADFLYGGAGNDKLTGEADWQWTDPYPDGDTFDGGTGNDTMYGSTGRDQYIFRVGDGSDVLHDAGNADLVTFEDLRFDQATYLREDADLVIQYGESDSLRIKKFFVAGEGLNTLGTGTIETFKFSDGYKHDEDIRSLLSNINNTAPTVEQGISDQSVNEDYPSFSFSIPGDAFSDADNDSLTYSVDPASLPSWLSFDGTTFSGTPENDDVGSFSIEVVASDGQASTFTTFTMTVVNVNDKPVVDTTISDVSSEEGSDIGFTLPVDAFTDVDVGDTLTYSATLADGNEIPAWLSFDPVLRRFAANDAPAGVYSIKVTATDSSGEPAEQTFTLTVAEVNHDPIEDQGIGDQSVNEDEVFSFPIPSSAFSDVDGDSLTYSVDPASLPAWLSFDGTTFSGTPENDDVDSFSIEVVASDGQASTSTTFTLTVVNVNDKPEVKTTISDVSSEEGNNIDFALPEEAFVDPDAGDTLRYSATLADGNDIPAWLSLDPVTGRFTANDAPAGVYSIRVTATDSSEASESQTFTLTVTEVDDSGELNVIQGTRFDETLTGTAGNDHILGEFGRDTINAGAGNDVIDGGGSNDNLFGEAGNDTFVIHGSDNDTDRISGGDGYDRIEGSTGDDVISLVDFENEYRVEEIDGVSGTDSIVGTRYDNTLDFSETTLKNIAFIDGGSGNDRITGSSDDDIIIGGEGSDVLRGGAGDDVFKVDGHNNGTDRFGGDAGYDRVVGGANDDLIGLLHFEGDLRVEEIDGGAGTNTIIGTKYGNTFDFSETTLINIQHIDGGDGDDVITGSAGDDVLIGSGGRDRLSGGMGNDSIHYDAEDRLIDGGTGKDRLVVMTDGLTDLSAADQYEHIQSIEVISLEAATANTIRLSAQSLLAMTDADNNLYIHPGENGTVELTDSAQWTSQGNVEMDGQTYQHLTNGGANLYLLGENQGGMGDNEAPQIDQGIGNLSVNEDDPSFSFSIPGDAFSDADGDSLTYNVDPASLPAWLSFDGTTFSGTPGNDDVGSFSIEVVASDGQASTFTTFTMTVVNVNDKPEVKTTISDVSSEEGSGIGFTLPEQAFVDPDAGDTLTYSATLADGNEIPAWLSFDPVAKRFAATDAPAGMYSIKVTATDNSGETAEQTFTLTVTEVDDSGELNVIQGSYRDEELQGTAGNDHILGEFGRDTIYAGAGNDLIDGGGSYDRMFGEAGNDTFVIHGSDNDTDRISGGDGYDRIEGSTGDDVISLVDFENEYRVEEIDGVSGTDSIVGTRYDNTLDFSETTLKNIAFIDGGSGNDRITGSSDDDIIIGGEGSDVLRGGAGDDVFKVDGQNNGTDRFGGDAGYDRIVGGANDDLIELLNFEGGRDALQGGSGNDTYEFYQGHGSDWVQDNGDLTDTDTVQFKDALHGDLWFSQQDNYLVIDVLGSGDQVKVTNWYTDETSHIEEIHAGDQVLYKSEIDALVNAMATFGTPSGGEMNLSESQQSEVNNAIAAAWQPVA
ncbi:putative Ig domain-containing protein [Hahella ganghwensis]|uniref:putative Ig domain-containing protein n=1 Tax=Hahella ganghwensis TaxID=286420 RepID=UPI00039C1745|nr:putative Ig domain-containing protein [Hahella ganghwensis]